MKAMDVTIKKYVELGFAAVPIGRGETKEGITYYKKPLTAWKDFQNEVPTFKQIKEWETLPSTGLALVTGKVSGIICVDLDSKDEDYNNKIKKVLPYTKAQIIGHPQKGGKFLFALTEEVTKAYGNTNKLRFGPNGCTEIFLSTQLVAIPPSLYATKNGHKHHYRWASEFHPMDLLDIPPITLAELEAVKMAAESVQMENIIEMLPTIQKNLDQNGERKEATDLESEHRHKTMSNYFGRLLAMKTEWKDVPKLLLKYDRENFPSDQFFLDKSKGMVSNNEMLNVQCYISEFLRNIAKKKNPGPEQFFAMEELTSENFDSPPLEIKKKLKSLPDLRPDLIPLKLQNKILTIAEAASVSRESLLLGELAAIGSLINHKKMIRVKKSWVVAHNLYFLEVAPAGSRKSFKLSTSLQSVRKLDVELRIKARKQLVDMERKRELIESQLKEIKAQAKKMYADCGGDEEDEAFKEINIKVIKLQDQLNHEIYNPKLEMQKASQEKMFDSVSKNLNSGFFVFNEYATLDEMMSSSQSEKMRGFFLDGWDGTQNFMYETKHQGSVIMEQYSLGLYGQTQPTIFTEIMAGAISGKRDDGMIHRFLYSYTDASTEKADDAEVPLIVHNQSYDLALAAYELKQDNNPIALTGPAQEMLYSIETEIIKMKMAAESDLLKSFLSKLLQKIVQIASIFGFIDDPCDNWGIGTENLQRAYEIGMRQYQTFLELVKVPSYHYAMELARYIELGAVNDGQSLADLIRTFKFLQTAKMAEEVIGMLIESKYLVIRSEGSRVKIYTNKNKSTTHIVPPHNYKPLNDPNKHNPSILI